MSSRTFSVSATVPARPEDVIDFLAALDRHRGLHPYVVAADVTASGVGLRGPWQEWAVVERPRLGPFRYTIRFHAHLDRTSPTSLHSDVDPLPGSTMSIDTVAVPLATDDHGPRTEVTETCTITAPFFLLGYMAREARRAHTRTFALLPDQLGPDRQG